MAERDEVDRRLDELVLRALTFALAHPCEAERVEHVCVGVVLLVVVGRVRCRGDHRAFRDERPVVERDVLDHLAREPDCIVQAVESTYAR